MERIRVRGYNKKVVYDYPKEESKMNRSERRALKTKSSKFKITKK